MYITSPPTRPLLRDSTWWFPDTTQTLVGAFTTTTAHSLWKLCRGLPPNPALLDSGRTGHVWNRSMDKEFPLEVPAIAVSPFGSGPEHTTRTLRTTREHRKKKKTGSGVLSSCSLFQIDVSTFKRNGK